MKTTKFEIIKMIVEGEENFPNAFNPLFLKAIAVGAKEVYNAQADFIQLRPLIDSASYLIGQIEKCDNQIRWINALTLEERSRMNEELSDWTRQLNKYTESLTKVINML